MLTINAYFNFMGNTEEAMNFYKSVFGGEFTIFSRFKDLPGSENMAAHEKEKLMHISLTTESGTIMMATDFLESMGQTFVPGNQVNLCIQAESEEEVDKQSYNKDRLPPKSIHTSNNYITHLFNMT